jgi:hypothetical protein
MMATRFKLTDVPIRVTVGTGNFFQQPLYLARDVLEFSMLDVEVSLLSFEGGSPAAHIWLTTGLQRETAENYATAISSPVQTTFTSVGTQVITLQGGFLRYVAWQYSNVGSQTAATFYIECVGRKWVNDAA